jgi:hypothetical protein
VFRYTSTVIASGLLFLAGIGLSAGVVIYYFTHDFSLPDPSSTIDHLAIVGLLFMIIGFSTFCFTLLLHATEVRYGRPEDAEG